MMKRLAIGCAILGTIFTAMAQKTLPTDNWTYIQIDDNKMKWGNFDDPGWLRYFGLDMQDVNCDGYKDVLSGRFIYLNPGGDMESQWERIDMGFNVDGVLFTDVDDDNYADVIANAFPDVYWLEADNLEATAWKAMKIGELPKTFHTNGQGYLISDAVQGGKPEILLAAKDGIYMAEIPSKPTPENWNFIRIVKTQSDEGFDLGDIDEDGDLDIVASDWLEEEEARILSWYENPGKASSDWNRQIIDTTTHNIDRIKVSDMNDDGILDIIVSEERYPGEEPDANLYLFTGVKSANTTTWNKEILITQYSMNNLDVADIDKDGDMDIVTNEHKGPHNRTQLFINDGNANFTVEVIDKGKECHLGAQFADLDNDGDLDLVGHGWSNHKLMHVWRNDAKSNVYTWKHLSSAKGDLPATAGGNQQTATLLADINKDGKLEFFVTDRSVAPAVIMYMLNDDNVWEKYTIDDEMVRIEAGSAYTDIDGDGDIDIVFGGDGENNEMWWWENPYPTFDKNKSWKRYHIKNSGEKKHHDQLFGDFDGDGRDELVFWNQDAASLCLSEIPDKPKKVKTWDWNPIYTYSRDSEMEPLVGSENYPGWQSVNEHEGLYAHDIDGDGIIDIIGGGRWFKYQDGRFIENIIDASYTFTRTVAGQFIKGGRPEVILVGGDGLGPMILYEWHEWEGWKGSKRGTGTWNKKLILPEVENGHTLEAIDFNGDGHLDIFNAEMRINERNPDAEIRILLGDGKGNFTKTVVAKGVGVHEGKIGDIDDDGDYDILAKPYNWKAPRIDLFINQGIKE